ncbi:MAG: PEP-CTERM sorting domain-containing protein, partial [Chroococcales cyanobacterium metabat2.561]
MKSNRTNLLLAATTTLLVSNLSTAIPVQALTWTMNNGSLAGTNPITGS